MYVNLGGTALTLTHISRAVIDVALTMLTAAVLMLPLRRYLGYGRKQLQAAAKT